MTTKTKTALAVAGSVLAIPGTGLAAAAAHATDVPGQGALHPSGRLTLDDEHKGRLIRTGVRVARHEARLRGHELREGYSRRLRDDAVSVLRDRNERLRGRIARLERRAGGSTASVPLQAIAACESSGNPAAVGGGGQYRGKYQFSTSTWASVGGSGDPAAARRPSRTAARRCSTRAPAPPPGPSAAASPCGDRGALSSAAVSVAALRSAFPVLERVVYLNAGTDGPVPRAAQEAAARELVAEAEEGRATAHFERRFELQDLLRASYAELLGVAPDDVALTTSTSEGLGKVLAGMDLGPGDEIVTSDAEHPGLIGPLIAVSGLGVTVHAVPFAELADAVGPRTTLVACSHVNWRTGQLAPAGLAEVDVPVIYDGAQGIGAVPVDVKKLRCAAYAGSGQKWLCGADGTGMLYLAAEFRERVRAIAPAYTGFADASRGFESPLKPDARRYDTPSLAREIVAFSVTALDVLRAADLAAVLARGPALAEGLAERLAERGPTVAPRDHTTLVAWEDDDPEATRDRLAAEGIVIRNLPGTPLVRASVGAWSSEDDLERLLGAL